MERDGDAGVATKHETASQAVALVLALEQMLQMARCLLATLGGAIARDSEAAQHPAPYSSAIGLSPREMEILRLLAAGHSNRRIAHALFLSPRLVQRHVANIYSKLGVHCRAEATLQALHHDLSGYGGESLVSSARATPTPDLSERARRAGA